MSIDKKKMEDEEIRRFEDIFPKIKRDFENGRLDPKKFYPEFKFKEPYGLELENEPIYALSPFYEQVIVHVGPFPKNEFKKLYGISIEDLIELYKEDKVLPILSRSYVEYPSDYDELFRKALKREGHIPSDLRISSFLEEIRHEIDIFDEAYRILKEKFKGLKFDKDIVNVFKDSPNPKDKIINSITSSLFQLKAFGYDELYNRILEMKDQNDAYWHSFWYYSFLTRPITVGLGGYNNYWEEEIQFARKLKLEELIAPQFLLYKFPKNIEIYATSVSDPVKYWNKVEKIKDRDDVLNTLKEIPKCIENGNIEMANEIIVDRSKEITDVSKEAASIGYKLRIKTWIDFGFSILTPSALSIISPYVVPILLPVIEGIKKFRKEEYEMAIDKTSGLLSNLFLKKAKKIYIAPTIMWMKNIR